MSDLASSLSDDGQFDAAEEAVLQAIALLPDEGEQFRVCDCHRTLGNIYQSKGEIEKAIHHYEIALGIASPFNWHGHLFWIHYQMAGIFRDQRRFDDAQAHVERAKLHAVDDAYYLGLAMELQAGVWHKQGRLGEARTEALRAADVYEELGAGESMERCRELLRKIENGLVASDQSALNCELL